MGSIENAKRSLEGLSLGDAFGELFFRYSPYTTTFEDLPKGVWAWTDDTHMALSIVETLHTYGCVNQEALIKAFAKRYKEDSLRGYSQATSSLLRKAYHRTDWQEASASLFGSGSYGNGAAMRVAPVGGFFADDPVRAAKEAQLSAVLTHAHPEGQAGAIAIAVAASIVASGNKIEGRALIATTMEFVPDSETRQKIETSLDIPQNELLVAIDRLGTGTNFSAQDTVPFCLWSAAFNLESFEEAMWWTVKGMGDCDTTCAIVGGIVALAAKSLPAEWMKRREPLPEI